MQFNKKLAGKLKIYAVKEDAELLLYEDNNIVTGGMGAVLASFFASEKTLKKNDIEIGYFQVGIGKKEHFGATEFLQLGQPLIPIPAFPEPYGKDTSLVIKNLKGIQFGNNFQTPGETNSPGEFIEINYTNANFVVAPVAIPFAVIDESKITRISDTGVAFQITLDKNTCNGLTLTEIGLFSRNFNGGPEDNPILVAYKSIDGLPFKDSTFSFRFDWVIEAVDSIESLLIPTKSDVYYGLTSTPIEATGRRFRQTLDFYKSPVKIVGGNACVVFLYPGGFTSGDKKEIVQQRKFFITNLLRKGISVISANYNYVQTPAIGEFDDEAELAARNAFFAANNNTGISVDTAREVQSPIPNPFETQGSGYGSNEAPLIASAALLPSSTAPLRLPNNRINAFTDVVRLIQFIRTAQALDPSLNINTDFLVPAGGSAGGSLASWLGFAPECSTIVGNQDIVETQSNRVFATIPFAAITDYTSFFGFGSLNVLAFQPGPVGRKNYQLPAVFSSTLFVRVADPNSTGIGVTSSLNYPSGVYYSSALEALPEHFKYGFNKLFGTDLKNIGYGFKRAESFHDWANIPKLKDHHEHNYFIPLEGKQYWSPYFQASNVGTVEFPNFPGAVWGHKDNSGVYTYMGYIGPAQLSSTNIHTQKSWIISLDAKAIFFLGSAFGIPGADIIGGNFQSSSSNVPKNKTVRQHLIDNNNANLIPLIEAIPNKAQLLDLSGFGWGPPDKAINDPAVDPFIKLGINRWYVSSITSSITEGASIINMPDPAIDLDKFLNPALTGSGDHVSGLPLAQYYTNHFIDANFHSPSFGDHIFSLLVTLNGGNNVHTTSSVLNKVALNVPSNLVFPNPLFKTNFERNLQSGAIDWLIGLLAEKYPTNAYQQFVGKPNI